MDSTTLRYTHFERLPVPAPVDRLAYIAERCRGRRVLDLGCLDETALVKRDTEHWLHGRIAAVASEVLGLDLSESLPGDGLRIGITNFSCHFLLSVDYECALDIQIQ